MHPITNRTWKFLLLWCSRYWTYFPLLYQRVVHLPMSRVCAVNAENVTFAPWQECCPWFLANLKLSSWFTQNFVWMMTVGLAWVLPEVRSTQNSSVCIDSSPLRLESAQPTGRLALNVCNPQHLTASRLVRENKCPDCRDVVQLHRRHMKL